MAILLRPSVSKAARTIARAAAAVNTGLWPCTAGNIFQGLENQSIHSILTAVSLPVEQQHETESGDGGYFYS